MHIEELCRRGHLAPGFLAAAEYHQELPSTSDYLLAVAAEPHVPRPLLVVAERQTAGRGRGNNHWWSAEGALTFSLLLDPPLADLPPERQPLVSLAAGLALQQALVGLAPGQHVGLKWPNDVWLNQRKVAGILVEAPTAQPPAVVIGVGINVNNSFATAPEELRSQATALSDELNAPCDAASLLESFLQELERELSALADGRLRLAERWPAVCVLRGRWVQVTTGRELWEGECLGVDDGGALLVDDGNRVQRCVAGSVVRTGPVTGGDV